MQKYEKTFIEEKIDGEILLNDINEENIKIDLNVTSIDAQKIMKEINKLKRFEDEEEDEKYDVSVD